MYTVITIQEMREFLKSEKGWVERAPEGQEIYFEWKTSGCIVKVFSSIPSKSSMGMHYVCRKKGTDAIRVVLLYVNKKNKVVVLGKYPRVTRQQNWRTHLKKRIMEAYVEARDLPTCPRCSSKLVLRIAGVTKNHFYGCTLYPECRFTRSLSDYALDESRLEDSDVFNLPDMSMRPDCLPAPPLPPESVQLDRDPTPDVVIKKDFIRSVVEGFLSIFK